MISLIIILVVVGFGLFLLNRFVPLDPKVRALVNYLVIFILAAVVVLWLLELFGVYRSGVLDKLTG